jgi:hypothetical protein
MDDDAVRDSLLATIRGFDVISASTIITYIAGYWGELAARRDHHHNSRIIAEKVVVFVSDQEPAPNRPLYSGDKTASSEEVEQLSREWAQRLAKMPEDEALSAFCEAFWEWLLTTDLSIYRHDEDTDFAVVGRTYQYWRDFTAV